MSIFPESSIPERYTITLTQYRFLTNALRQALAGTLEHAKEILEHAEDSIALVETSRPCCQNCGAVVDVWDASMRDDLLGKLWCMRPDCAPAPVRYVAPDEARDAEELWCRAL